ncbi:tartrate-resistant acid phosphatase type 5 family protein [Hyphomicrobium sp. CS1GBMeth3]|uniref:purple acid phosphatase family protein n=1 Tax=Hyphomicrobium sp. CS1GBMeth3 TaxID=1892845 RepID=UPI0009312264|nr:tartrate-resistant acid phosphatase type 5 family protein [Hyphomicrobium sp. CS1GBMeth3]
MPINTWLTRRALLAKGLAAASAAVLPSGSAVPDEASFSFLVVGDWGHAHSEGQRKVARAMGMAARRDQARFVVSTGDNFYPRGVTGVTDPLWRKAFESVYVDNALQGPWYPVLGNHDHKGNVAAERDYSAASSRWSMPADYYRHTEVLGSGNVVELFFLDTLPLSRAGDGFITRLFEPSAATQLSWLSAALAESKATWKIVVGHHPVFSTGPHGNTPALIASLKPLFDRYHVAAYVNGHDHNLQHIIVDGVSYLTCGSGAEAHPAAHSAESTFSAAVPGFMVVKMTPSAILVTFLDSQARVLYRATIPPRTAGH